MTELEKPELFDLTDNDLLDQIVNSITKVQGESNNKKIIILSCISKDLPYQYRDGLSLVISSKSSAGKSTIIDNCLKPFTKDVFPFTKITDSFFQRHFKDISLNGKILHQEQIEKTNYSGQVSFSIPKFQLSEGNTRYGLSERDKDGKFTDTILQVTGFPIYITSTTNPDIEPQQLNRITLLQTDESDQQTNLVKKSILNDCSINPDNYSNDNLDDLTNLCEIYKKMSKSKIILEKLSKENCFVSSGITIAEWWNNRNNSEISIVEDSQKGWKCIINNAAKGMCIEAKIFDLTKSISINGPGRIIDKSEAEGEIHYRIELEGDCELFYV